jgi:hypothetical protein
MRREKVWPLAVEEVVAVPETERIDEKGNPVAVGRDSTGRTLEVVVALDDRDFVITVIVRRKPR